MVQCRGSIPRRRAMAWSVRDRAQTRKVKQMASIDYKDSSSRIRVPGRFPLDWLDALVREALIEIDAADKAAVKSRKGN